MSSVYGLCVFTGSVALAWHGVQTITSERGRLARIGLYVTQLLKVALVDKSGRGARAPTIDNGFCGS
jgi:hypothetical protein